MPMSDETQPQQGVAQSERRAHRRYAVQVEIELKRDDDPVPMRLVTTDLSRNGCYVEMMMPLPVGVRIHAVLWLGEKVVRVRGCIVTRHPQYGNGIMFLAFQDDGQKELRAFLAHLRSD